MPTRIVGAVAALLLVGCGDTVTSHIDALRESAARYAHTELPSPERHAEIWGSEPVESYGLRSRLRKDAQARAILDAGETAVPDLVRLLDDPERRTLAAVFLAEIGGEQAATALLGHWRDLRGKAQEKRVYRTRGRSGKWSKTRLYEGVDQEFYRELIHALCYAGRPVSAAVAADTRAAMDQAERRQAAGEDLRRKEKRPEEPTGEIELRWDAEPVETACEGLEVLAMVGAPEAPALYTRALGSPVQSLRWTGVQYVVYLGEGAKQALPALGALLDDAGALREEVLWQLALLLDRESLPPRPLTDEKQEELARRYKQRLRELGHLR